MIKIVKICRQDILSTSIGGGVTLAMFGTALLAAIIGTAVSSALTMGMNRLATIEFEFPEFTLPELPQEAVEEVRSLESKYPWVALVENVYDALRVELNHRKSSKFNKYLSSNSL